MKSRVISNEVLSWVDGKPPTKPKAVKKSSPDPIPAPGPPTVEEVQEPLRRQTYHLPESIISKARAAAFFEARKVSDIMATAAATYISTLEQERGEEYPLPVSERLAV